MSEILKLLKESKAREEAEAAAKQAPLIPILQEPAAPAPQKKARKQAKVLEQAKQEPELLPEAREADDIKALEGKIPDDVWRALYWTIFHKVVPRGKAGGGTTAKTMAAIKKVLGTPQATAAIKRAELAEWNLLSRAK
nr:hypothetical protein [Candidatus Sigynarchaeota archaeon]